MRSRALEHARRLLQGDLLLGTSPEGEVAYLPEKLRFQHQYIVGKSGFGKTTLILNMVRQDLLAGRGLAVIGPDEDLFERQILPLIPEERLDDVVYMNPADTERPVPLNPFHVGPGEDLDLKVDDTLTVLRRIFGDDTGGGAPRMETILRHAVHTLTRVPCSSPLDIERLLDRDDVTYRNWVVSRLQDEESRRFWTTVYPAYPKDAHLSVLNRLSPFLQPQRVRHTLCAAGAFDFRRAMDTGKIVLVNLSESRLGTGNARIIGQLVVTRLSLAALSRADLPEPFRRPFFVYIDEFQTFCGASAESYQTMFSRTRKYHVPLTIAHLQTRDLPEAVMRNILGTVSTLVVFRVGHDDATRLGRELITPTGTDRGTELRPLEPGLLVDLPVGHAWCRIGNHTRYLVTPPPPADGTKHIAVEAKRRSRASFGVPFARRPRVNQDETTQALDQRRRHAIESADPGRVF